MVLSLRPVLTIWWASGIPGYYGIICACLLRVTDNDMAFGYTGDASLERLAAPGPSK
jgi:hypothetical protein